LAEIQLHRKRGGSGVGGRMMGTLLLDFKAIRSPISAWTGTKPGICLSFPTTSFILAPADMLKASSRPFAFSFSRGFIAKFQRIGMDSKHLIAKLAGIDSLTFSPSLSEPRTWLDINNNRSEQKVLQPYANHLLDIFRHGRQYCRITQFFY